MHAYIATGISAYLISQEVCGTNSPSECVFSASEKLVTPLHANLKPDKVDKLVIIAKKLHSLIMYTNSLESLYFISTHQQPSLFFMQQFSINT